MEKIGKISEWVNDDFGYIIDHENNYYLFSKKDICPNQNIDINSKVIFKPINESILKATLIEKFTVDD